MVIESQRDKILEQLENLNLKLEQQNSINHIFMTGIIYGVGFFVGSAVLATIVLGVLGSVLGKIDWVKDNYQTGISIIKGSVE